MANHTIQDLRQRQALPLEIKILMTKTRIREWIQEYGEDGVYISFSGGKDSTVLLHLVRELYPNVKAVFFDTGLEYPEIKEFVKSFDNVDIVRPKMTFKKVIETYGYPFISKEVSHCIYDSRRFLDNPEKYKDRKPIKVQKETDTYKPYSLLKLEGNIEYNGKKSMFCADKWIFLLDAPFKISDRCCNVMKKKPAYEYGKQTGRYPITAQMASESRMRTLAWLKNGCNAFNATHKISNPMSFWTENDVLKYIKDNNIKIASVYGEVIVDDTEQLNGQMDFSDLGLMSDKRKYKTTGCSRTGCMYCGYGCHLEQDGEGRFERMKETHPKLYDYIMRSWDQGGLGYKDAIDWINNNSNLNIKY